MRFVRVLVLACAALFGAAACANATAMANNKAGVWVTVNPGTVTAGSRVQVQASCGGNTTSATVTSPAFGSLTLQAAASGGNLAASVTVPTTTGKGTFDVRLSCSGGSQASTTLTVQNSSSNAQATSVPGPNTGGGFLANGGSDSGAGAAGLLSDPARRGPVLWLGLATVCLVAATVLGLRRRPIRRERPWSGRTGAKTTKAGAVRTDPKNPGTGRAAALDPDKVPLAPPVDPWSRAPTPAANIANTTGRQQPASRARR